MMCGQYDRLWPKYMAKEVTIQWKMQENPVRFVFTMRRLGEPYRWLLANCTETTSRGGLSMVRFKGVWVRLLCSHMRKKCWVIGLSLFEGLKGTKCENTLRQLKFRSWMGLGQCISNRVVGPLQLCETDQKQFNMGPLNTAVCRRQSDEVIYQSELCYIIN